MLRRRNAASVMALWSARLRKGSLHYGVQGCCLGVRGCARGVIESRDPDYACHVLHLWVAVRLGLHKHIEEGFTERDDSEWETLQTCTLTTNAWLNLREMRVRRANVVSGYLMNSRSTQQKRTGRVLSNLPVLTRIAV